MSNAHLAEHRIRVLIADDDVLMRESLADLISAEPSLELVGAARDAEEAARLAQERHPDVALLDVKMPRGGGPAAARAIKETSPNTRVLALSAYGDRVAVVEMLRAGAIGYLVKGSPATEILKGIHEAEVGRPSVALEVVGRVVEELSVQLEREESELQERKNRVQQIKSVLEGDILKMAFQPIFDLETYEVVGVEALARFMTNPQRTPDVWFQEAESLGLGLELELAAVRVALGHLESIDPSWFFAVNVSPNTVLSPDFVGSLEKSPTNRVVIEVTEHARVEDYNSLNASLEALRGLGVRLAIDDAGAGYASLKHILHLRPEIIKLDVSLTQGIDSDPARRALGHALIAFASEIGALVVAEGIETQEALDALRSLRVSYGQGYFLARPGDLPIENVWR